MSRQPGLKPAATRDRVKGQKCPRRLNLSRVARGTDKAVATARFLGFCAQTMLYAVGGHFVHLIFVFVRFGEAPSVVDGR